jgi:hypothetical protein
MLLGTEPEPWCQLEQALLAIPVAHLNIPVRMALTSNVRSSPPAR